MTRKKVLKMAILPAALAACTSMPTSAPEPQSTDFFFSYDRSSLKETSALRQMYTDLSRKAEQRCAKSSIGDDQATCQSELMERVVAGIDNNELRQHHMGELGGAASTGIGATDFVFHFNDDEVASFASTGRLYDRLQAEAKTFCAQSGLAATEDGCANAIIDRMVLGVDDRRLTSQHQREAGKGTVIVSDPIFLEEDN